MVRRGFRSKSQRLGEGGQKGREKGRRGREERGTRRASGGARRNEVQPGGPGRQSSELEGACGSLGLWFWRVKVDQNASRTRGNVAGFLAATFRSCNV